MSTETGVPLIPRSCKPGALSTAKCCAWCASVQDCDSACLEQHLQSAGPACKVQMTPSANAAMQGKLTLPNGASLDLEQVCMKG